MSLRIIQRLVDVSPRDAAFGMVALDVAEVACIQDRWPGVQRFVIRSCTRLWVGTVGCAGQEHSGHASACLVLTLDPETGEARRRWEAWAATA